MINSDVGNYIFRTWLQENELLRHLSHLPNISDMTHVTREKYWIKSHNSLTLSLGIRPGQNYMFITIVIFIDVGLHQFLPWDGKQQKHFTFQVSCYCCLTLQVRTFGEHHTTCIDLSPLGFFLRSLVPGSIYTNVTGLHTSQTNSLIW